MAAVSYSLFLSPVRVSSFQRLALFQLGHHVDAQLVAAAEEVGGQEGVDDGLGHHGADHARAHGDDVGVVVLAGQAGADGLGADRAADAIDLVGGDGDAQARAADQHALVEFAG